MDQSMSPGSAGARRIAPMRIAQLAPLYERVPPQLYGGTERVVSYLTEELVRRGHEVTLFASGDSQTTAKLHPGCPAALRLLGQTASGAALQLPMLSAAYEGDNFDIVHSHLDFWAFPYAELKPEIATVTTMHGRLDVEPLHPIYRCYRRTPLVSISDAQRLPLPFMNWAATIHHGLPRNLLQYNPKGGGYLAYLGRIAYEKRPDLAIEVARRAGIPFKLAAKVDVVDREYYEAMIKPRLAPPDIEYIGEINEHEKNEFLGNAMALLFTIDWPEPFGLAMIEALACGTPVITRNCGSTPEIVKSGKNGFIADTIEELVQVVRRIPELSREACRRDFEERFSVARMADQYERLYERLIAAAAGKRRGQRVDASATTSARGDKEDVGTGLEEAAEFSAGTGSGG
jgi:glycosyltransferase involved in cell wall biosynthesis